MTVLPLLLAALPQIHPPDGDSFGASFCEIGDLDGDGERELLVGDPLNGPGRVLVVSPRTGGLVVQHTGARRGERFGASVVAPGDLDGDGVPDLLVGSAGGPEHPEPPGERGPGRVTAISGTGARLHAIEVPPDTLGYGYETHLAPAPVLCAVGDANLDGVPDYAVGSKLDATAGIEAGAVRIFSGDDGRLLRAIFGQPGERFGASLAAGRVLTADGPLDLVVGSVADPLRQRDRTSTVSVVSLADGARRRTHPARPGAFGFAVCVLADLDGDGGAEYAVSQPFERWSPNPVRCFSGLTGQQLRTWAFYEGEAPDRGFSPKSLFGAVLAPSPDGRRVLISRPEGLRPTVWIAEAEAEEARTAVPVAGFGDLGVAVCEIDDRDGDGVPDVAVATGDYWLLFELGEIRLYSGASGRKIGTLVGHPYRVPTTGWR